MILCGAIHTFKYLRGVQSILPFVQTIIVTFLKKEKRRLAAASNGAASFFFFAFMSGCVSLSLSFAPLHLLRCSSFHHPSVYTPFHSTFPLAVTYRRIFFNFLTLHNYTISDLFPSQQRNRYYTINLMKKKSSP